MTSRNDALMGLLHRMTQLTSTLSRGQLFERATAAAGVTLDRPLVTILVTLQAADRPLRVGELAARMQLAGPYVTRQLNDLEQRRLVKRVPDPDDQRVRLIALTPSGEGLIGRYLQVIDGWFDQALSEWSGDDQRDLVRLIGRLVDDLTTHLDAIVNEDAFVE
ncbi:MarR family winged helix-turn-helix transcriptional regulator [Nonomuraea aurantiaca]|jgi:DNA-binding MarR family transcriptional regulator|uniref:MarR family winged helix-turn-helix transcriptional regulator n=1 Tax=Nonomuraea aurantiaca TaxID=2878562 RepID=UPI001CDA3A64|nr:MarR family transcriptional regulator [Nonomuraea aurantiaca]MCA2225658.1 MarR family transcriptional regulator [Nonomuraea aurantiaca]